MFRSGQKICEILSNNTEISKSIFKDGDNLRNSYQTFASSGQSICTISSDIPTLRNLPDVKTRRPINNYTRLNLNCNTNSNILRDNKADDDRKKKNTIGFRFKKHMNNFQQGLKNAL